MNFKLFLRSLVFTLLIPIQLFSQTTLSAGDVAVIGLNGDTPDQFAFVLLVDIEAGTEIRFTDSGVLSTGDFRGNEGAIKYTAPSAQTAGTVFEVDITSLPANFTVDNDSDVGTNGMNISASGDQLIAFQGTGSSPTFIFALQINSNVWQVGSDASTASDLPPGLTNGLTAVAAGAGSGAGDEFDNSVYDQSILNGTKEELLTAIANNANWAGSNSAIAYSFTSFTVNADFDGFGFNTQPTSSSTTRTSTLISFETSEQATATLYYADNSDFSINLDSIQFLVTDSIFSDSITGLEKNSSYFVKVHAIADDDSEIIISDTLNFTTLDDLAFTSGPTVSDTNYTSITLDWTSNNQTQGRITFSTDMSYSDTVYVDDNTSFSETVSGLEANTAYNLKVEMMSTDSQVVVSSNIAVSTLAADPAIDSLIISEIVDATESGAKPRYIELTNTSHDSISLDGIKINEYSNGGTSAILRYTFDAIKLGPSESIVVTNASEGEYAGYNLDIPDNIIYSQSIFNTGDDVYEIVTSDDHRIDIYGVIGTDGTGEDWEFLDSYTVRKSSILTGIAVFDVADWDVAATNTLDGQNGSHGNFVTPGTHEYDGKPSSFAFTSSPTVDSIEIESVNILFEASELATAVLRYGLTDAYTDSIEISTSATSFNQEITGLTESTLYHFNVTIFNSDSSNSITSSDDTFTTAASVFEFTSGPTTTETTDSTITVGWATSALADGYILFGATKNYTDTTFIDALTNDSSITFENLRPNSSYYFRIVLANAADSDTLDQASNANLTTGTATQTVLFPGIVGESLKDSLAKYYQPETVFSYDNSRLKMYSNIENDHGYLSLFYTGRDFFTVGIPSASEVNTEHIWPQSKGADSNRASDLHILRPVIDNVNSERNNHPFNDIDDVDTERWWRTDTAITTIPVDSIDEYSEYANSEFEPREASKGDAARAMFYFASVYHNDSIDMTWYSPQIATLRAWHQEDKITRLEQYKTQLIAAEQGKVNPFLLDSTLVERLFEDDPLGFSSNPNVFTKTDSSAQIKWTANSLSTAVIYFGLSASYTDSIVIASAHISDTISIDGLSENTTYHYSVKITKDGDTETVQSSDATFTTDYSAASDEELASIIITELVDGPESGGKPKMLELTNVGSTSVNLNGLKIRRYSNGGTSPSTAYTFDVFILEADSSLVLTNASDTEWASYSLSIPTYIEYSISGISSNGDDVYELVNSDDETLDLFGRIGEDGTGTDWDFLDSYATRNSNITSNNSTFTISEWNVRTTETLLNESGNLSNFLTPGKHIIDTSVQFENIPSVDNITTNSSQINFSSTDSITALIRYGLTEAYSDSVTINTKALSFSEELSGLTENTEYHFNVTIIRSSDSSQKTSVDATFTTVAAALEFTQLPAVIQVSDTTADIRWESNHASTAVIYYGLDSNYGDSLVLATPSLSDTATISGLTANTEYHFNVKITKDGDTESVTSSDDSLTTTNLSSIPTIGLFYSEYIEGSSNNKALEIYNGTGEAIDLANYAFVLFGNGSETPTGNLVFNSSRILEIDSVYVVANSSANDDIKNEADTLHSLTFFNGDDALAIMLRYNFDNDINQYIDIIGKIGEDPGSNWNANGVSTVNQTLRRKDGTTEGVSTNPISFDPSLEWDSYATDNSDNLGFYILDNSVNFADAVLVDSITQSTANIRFSSSDSITAVIRYGLTTNYSDSLVLNTANLSFDEMLSSLTESTEYHYNVTITRVSDSDSKTTDDASFTTLASALAFTVEPLSFNVTDTTADLRWTSNHASTATVYYGLTNSYGDSVVVATAALSDTVSLTGLTAGTEYHFTVKLTKDGDTETIQSSDDSLTTTNIASIPTTGLFFSEYIEGSSSNKAIEIYNGTGIDIDLANYAIVMYRNGLTTTDNELLFNSSLILPADSLYIIGNSSAIDEIKNVSDTLHSMTFFNGDDALAIMLRYNFDNGINTHIDIFGKIGEQPSPNWSANGVETSEQTLRRKDEITEGVSENPVTFDPSVEWDSFAQNTTNGLGERTTIVPPAFTSGPTVDSLSLSQAFISFATDDSVTAKIYYGLSASYTDSLELAASTSFSDSLTGLSQGTDYHYNVIITRTSDAVTNESGDATFTTNSESLVFTDGPTTFNLTDSTSDLSWTSNQLATAVIYYGLDANYGDSIVVATATLSDTITFTNLTANTDYHYSVKLTKDGDTETVSSEDATFTTDFAPASSEELSHIIITEVVDGPESGGKPKMLELTNVGSTSVNMNGVKVRRYSNGGTSPSTAYTFASFFLDADSSIVLTNVTDAEWAGYGLVIPTHIEYSQSGISSNGNDVYELVNSDDETLDLFGRIGEDGTGTDWDFLDSYATRNSNITSNNATFTISEWNVRPTNTLDAEVGNLANFLSPGQHTIDLNVSFASNPSISNIGSFSADISFSASDASTAVIRYGTTTNYSDSIAMTSATEFIEVLSSLNPNTEYHYNVTITRTSDNSTRTSDDATFTTLEAIYFTAEPSVDRFTTDSILINFSSNDSSTAVLYYGTSANLTDSVLSSPSQDHSVVISGLTAETEYFFNVKITDLTDTYSKTSDLDSATTETEGLVFNINPTSFNITDSTADIFWESNHAATAQIYYGLDSNYGDSLIVATATLSDTVSLTGLTAGTEYHFSVKLTKDGDTETIQSADDSLTTTNIASIPTTGLFFSEYIEGSSNNKAVEIYNGTGETIDLSNYAFLIFGNGGTTANQQFIINESKLLNDGDVYVVGNSSAIDEIKNLSDTTGSLTFFNGDDALAIMLKYHYENNIESYIDIIGKIGEDPGSSWEANGVSTANQTLRRKDNITAGVSINPASFDPSLEWDSFAQDTYNGLGERTTIVPPAFTSGPTVDSLSLSQAFISFATDDSVTAKIYYGLTASYTDSLELAASTSFSDSLTGLSQGTDYHYNVIITRTSDAVTNESGDATFTTNSESLVFADGPTTFNITDSTSDLSWTSNQLATAVIYYGLDENYGDSIIVATAALSDTITFTNLTANTDYHYSVKLTKDGDTETVSSADATFTTDFAPASSEELSHIIITEVVDGPESGGKPKIVELFNAGETSVNLKGLAIRVYSNGNLTYNTAYSFDTFFLEADSSIVLSNSSEVEWLSYGLNVPTNIIYSLGSLNSNGDDVYELVNSDDETLDLFGRIGEDGTGTDWDFLDSYATRNSNITSNNATFTISEWNVRPTNTLDGEVGNLANILSPGQHTIDLNVSFASNPSISNIGSFSADISFSASDASTAVIRYGTTTNYSDSIAVTSATEFFEVLSSLNPNTEYHYNVTITRTSDNSTRTSDDATFTTLEAIYFTADPSVDRFTTDSILISFSSNDSSTAVLYYGTSANLTDSVLSSASQDHSVVISGLTAETEYFFNVKITDLTDTYSKRSDLDSATTESESLQFTTSPYSLNVLAESAEISWEANYASTAILYYGLSETYTDSIILAEAALSDTVTISGLSVSNTYHYSVKLTRDGESETIQSSDATFTTVKTINPGDVIISEIMYDSKASSDEEWIELTNTTEDSIDLSGWYVTDASSYPATGEGDFEIPDGTKIGPGQYLVFAWSDLSDAFDYVRVEASSGHRSSGLGLGNSGDNIAVYTSADGTGTLIDGSASVQYSDDSPGNTGTTIERNVSGNYEDDWDASTNDFGGVEVAFGTPGFKNSNASMRFSSGPIISNITNVSSDLSFTLSENSTARVNYGTDSTLTNTIELDLATDFSTTLSALSAGTVYYVQVTATNEAATDSVSSEILSFTTIENLAFVSAPSASSITNSSATIAFESNIASLAKITYGKVTLDSLVNLSSATEFSEALTGLDENTAYIAQVTLMTSDSSQTLVSDTLEFSTLDDFTLEFTNAFSIDSVTSSSAYYSFAANSPVNARISYGLDDTNLDQSMDLGQVQSFSSSLTELNDSTVYYAAVHIETTDSAQAIISDTLMLTTLNLQLMISNIASAIITDTTAILAFTTNEAASAVLRYGLTTSYSDSILFAENTSFTDTLFELIEATEYHYQITVSNAYNTVSSEDQSFTTSDIGDIPTSGIYFSEYIEGSSNNKAVEIYNGTGRDIDLKNYAFLLYGNGSTTPTVELLFNETRILTAGDVYVVGNASAAEAIKVEADTLHSLTFFNGDDALAIKLRVNHDDNLDIFIDVIGKIGEDPSSGEWGTGETTTKEHSIRRKIAITTGDTDAFDDFDPATEYDGYPQDSFDDIGQHITSIAYAFNVNPTTSSITNNSAVISFETNEVSTATINYGLSSNNLDQSINLSSNTTFTSSLTALTDSTTYYYAVTAVSDDDAETIVSDTMSFTTLENLAFILAADTTNVTNVSATIAWQSNLASLATLSFGENNLDSAIELSEMTHFSYNLTNLNSGTSYIAQVRLTLSDSSQTISSDTIRFTTLEEFNIVFESDFSIDSVSTNSAQYSFSANAPVFASLRYGTTRNDLEHVMNLTQAADFSGTISNLTDTTAYFASVSITSSDSTQTLISDTVAFTTKNLLLAIANLSVSEITENSAILSWTTNEAAESKLAYGLTSAYSDEIEYSSSTSFMDTIKGLNPNTEYHYQITAFNSFDTDSTLDLTFTTDDTISGVEAGDVVINEIMYDSKASTDEEWIELYNTTNKAIDVSGWYITDDDAYPAQGEGDIEIPQGTIIPAKGYIVVSWVDLTDIDFEVIAEASSGARSFGPGLGNSGDNIALYTNSDGSGILMDGSLTERYTDAAASNVGASIQRNVSGSYFDEWTSSTNEYGGVEIVFGTPGLSNDATGEYVPVEFTRNPEAVEIGLSTARIIWETNKKADATLFYGLDSITVDSISFDAISNGDHVLTSLSDSTLYFYAVRVNDDSISIRSAYLSFRTESQSSQGNIFPGIKGDALLSALRTEYKPASTLGYDTARDSLFGRIDNINGVVTLVYTGFELSHTYGTDRPSLPVNTEHTWPQSKGADGLRKSDLHHLYGTYEAANGARGSNRFADIDDNETTKWWFNSNTAFTSIPDISVRDNYSESTSSAFEPREVHKGNVARAMIYFYTVHFNEITQANKDWFNDQVPTLFAWHNQDPADENELRRNTLIERIQGNANPYILDPTLFARAIDSTSAFAFLTLPAVSEVTETSAKVSWSTTDAAIAAVYYGTTTAYSDTIYTSTALTSDNVVLSNLLEKTTYHYKVAVFKENSLNTAVSSDMTFTTVGASDFKNLIISEVVDGPEAGGKPKYLEITNTSASSVDLTGLKINFYINGNNTTFSSTTLSGIILPAGASYVSTNATEAEWAGYDLAVPQFISYENGMNNNGDDVYELVDQLNLRVDIYGEVGVDGTGQAWEFLDSYAVRKVNIVNGNKNFTADEWDIYPVGTIADAAGNLSNFLTPGTHDFNGDLAAGRLTLIQDNFLYLTELSVVNSVQYNFAFSKPLASAPVVKESNLNQTVTYLANADMYYLTYPIVNSAKIGFEIFATDTAGNDSTFYSDSLAIQVVNNAKISTMAISSEFNMTIPENTFDYQTVIISKEADHQIFADNRISKVIDIQSSRELPEGKYAQISFKHDAISLDKSKLVLYKYEAGEWLRQNSKLTNDGLFTEIASFGKFAVFYDEAYVYLPEEYTLSQNYPNPFNPVTTIRFDLAKSEYVTLNIYNSLGKKVRTLINEVRAAGENTITFDAKNDQAIRLSSGVYFYQLKTRNTTITKKMILLK